MGAQVGSVTNLLRAEYFSLPRPPMSVALLRSAVLRGSASLLRKGTTPALPTPSVASRSFATFKSASPETPLMHYTATQQATASINHRMFYVNWIAMLFVLDAGSGLVDL